MKTLVTATRELSSVKTISLADLLIHPTLDYIMGPTDRQAVAQAQKSILKGNDPILEVSTLNELLTDRDSYFALRELGREDVQICIHPSDDPEDYIIEHQLKFIDGESGNIKQDRIWRRLIQTLIAFGLDLHVLDLFSDQQPVIKMPRTSRSAKSTHRFSVTKRWLTRRQKPKAPNIIRVSEMESADVVSIHSRPTFGVAICVKETLDEDLKISGFPPFLSELGALNVSSEDQYYLNPSKFSDDLLDLSDVISLVKKNTKHQNQFRRFRNTLPQEDRVVSFSDTFVFGFLLDEKLVSAASINLYQDVDVATLSVATHPDHRRQGYATTVASAAIAFSFGVCKAFIEFVTPNTEDSQGLALKLGFEKFATESVYKFKG